MSIAVIHTDGSCWPNPGGPGGWGCVIELNGKRTELSGRHPGPTTSNRMEIQAAIEALKHIPAMCGVIIYTDSQYLRNAGSSWIKLWRKRKWMTKTGQPVKNKDLFIELDRLAAMHSVKWKWLRSHANHYNENNRCDALADNARNQTAPTP